jgi:ferredoxin
MFGGAGRRAPPAADAKEWPMKVVVDRNKCCGYGICADICPEVFELDDLGFAYVSDTPVPEGLRDSAVEAGESCPEGAVSFRERVVSAGPVDSAE